MAKLIDWIRNASANLLDPQREKQLDLWASQVESAIARERRDFDYEKVAAQLQVPRSEDRWVAERTYERAVRRAWQDDVVTSKERAALGWVAQAVSLEKSRATAVEQRIGREHFEQFFAEAIVDGEIDARESSVLRGIAASMGTDVRSLVRRYFSEQGQSLLRGLFLNLVNHGNFTQDDWQRLVASATALGLPESELLQVIAPQAQQFVERVLADAKQDKELDEVERRQLLWLLERLQPPAGFCAYVRTEIALLGLLTDIARGRLPVTESARILLRAGEIAHYEGPAVYVQTKYLSSGPRVESHTGTATITDARLVFSSSTKSFEIPLRRVLEVTQARRGFDLKVTGKGGGIYVFEDDQLPVAIFHAAVKRANQTLVDQAAGLPTHHIPRDVRQRVWQKYGGRCAECSATDYLEFDHIIPVARGGSNLDNNVQLLCRRCNLKKSDNI